MTLGKIIKQYRAAHNITMQEFAIKCSLSKGYISMLENDRHPQNNKKVVPSITTFNKIASAMHITVDELLLMLPEDAPISLSDEPCSVHLSGHAAELNEMYNSLNEEGQEELLKYARLLAASEQYKKHCESELVEA